MFATRYTPSSLLSDLNRLSSEFDRVFGSQMSGNGGRNGGTFPPLNVWSDEDHLYVEAELPGFDLEDLEIVVTGENQLSLKGHRERPSQAEATWHRQERGYGNFTRILELPDQVNAEQVDAEFKHGVLTITLPKREEAKPRRIEVKVS
jgi:HSP20 family protein